VAGSITPRPGARDRTAVCWLCRSVGCARRRRGRTGLRRIARSRRISGGLRRWSRRGGGCRDGLRGGTYSADNASAAPASLHAGRHARKASISTAPAGIGIRGGWLDRKKYETIQEHRHVQAEVG